MLNSIEHYIELFESNAKEAFNGLVQEVAALVERVRELEGTGGHADAVTPDPAPADPAPAEPAPADPASPADPADPVTPTAPAPATDATTPAE